MDMQLPDMTAPEVTIKIKENLGTKFPRVAAFTGNTSDSHKQNFS